VIPFSQLVGFSFGQGKRERPLKPRPPLYNGGPETGMLKARKTVAVKKW